MINNVVLTGRLTKDVDLKHSQSGVAIGNFTLAVARNYKNASGNYDADFINCVAFKKLAETVANYAHKGSLIGVTGNINTSLVEDKSTGKKINYVKVIINQVQFLESKNSSNSNKTQSNNQNNTSFKGSDLVTDDQLPF